ncbi:cell division protein FtsQ/DivIB [Bacillus horti]|uniref:Cell division protein DivIB n=1 Tax=Caldalkalibacillus horti TaxID=77523 RepID=A0ABT9VUG2_9BACI|nr:FtsQ-type POTRA domain-containing protein [Bacillus horti]MDQ0164609.1 cell division protein FtsQ [Bacillus horti]
MNNNKVIYDDRIPKLKEQRKLKSNKVFILLIFLFFALILLILFFQSPLSKLATIEISGNALLSDGEVVQAAEIQSGMSYFQFSKNGLEQKIAQMVQVEEVHVERVFPNHLYIEITELPVVAFWLQEQNLYPILSSGHIIFQEAWTDHRVQQPILTGWSTKEGIIELSKELDYLSDYVSNQISEITLTPIDSDPYRLTLYMEDGNEVRTSIRKFAERMNLYPDFVEEINSNGELTGIYHLFDAIWFEDPMLDEGESGESGAEGAS